MPNVEWIGAHGTNYTAGRGGYNVDTIGIHYTATNASARNNGLYFSRPNANASAHYFVDGSGTIIQSVSEKDTAWALGSWSYNCRAISIEVVSAGQDFTDAEISELSWLVRDIMTRYGIPESRVIRHYDVTGKHCPAPYVNNGKWAALKSRISRGESMSGWIQKDGRWWYKYSDGTYPAGEWEKIDGVWYLFDNDGWMLTGWQQVDGMWFWMDSSGAMVTGWKMIDGYWYLFDSDGVMVTGWKSVDGYWYLFSEKHDGTFGVMLTGWQLVDGQWYYMDSSGVMKTNWQYINDAWYYLNPDGVMVTGWKNIDGSLYLFDESGAMKTGWADKDGERVFLKDSGVAARSEIIYDKEAWYAIGSDYIVTTDVSIAEDGCIVFE